MGLPGGVSTREVKEQITGFDVIVELVAELVEHLVLEQRQQR